MHTIWIFDVEIIVGGFFFGLFKAKEILIQSSVSYKIYICVSIGVHIICIMEHTYILYVYRVRTYTTRIPFC